MDAYVGVTDYDWYRFLAAEAPAHEEVNFWKPGSGRLLKALQPGAPFLFKLKREHNNAIVGFGTFVRAVHLPIRLAWDYFQRANGVPSSEQLLRTIESYRKRFRKGSTTYSSEIGCLLIVGPVFFPPELWIRGPTNWAPSIVQGSGVNLRSPEYARIWSECLERAQLLQLGSHTAQQIADHTHARQRYGAERSVKPRLGQGTFRATVLDAYGRACAVTTEHSIPVLEAAHIRPFSDDGLHDTSNGLLLRVDIHRLFDGGYVTVTPDGILKVSRRLEEEFNNGKVYYAMNDRPIQLPKDPRLRPDPELLRWHNEEVFANP
ncbi:MAG: HNH endonuclease [Deltaproteobacteria bacterium]|nr:MAG: HNH endonuclease [Deltaproteobacteria bacterium]